MRVLTGIGRIGERLGPAWGGGAVSTRDRTLRRRCGVSRGDPNGVDAFDPSREWEGYDVDTFDGLGSHSVVCPD